MPTSGVDVLIKTAQQVVKDALVLINVVPASQNVSQFDLQAGINTLNLLLQTWTTNGVYPWRKQDAEFQPVQGQAEYAIQQRPLEIIEMRWRHVGGTEIPMYEITHEEYQELPDKVSQGIPTSFYVRRDLRDTTIFVWPVPSTLTTETFLLTYNRRTEVIVDGDDEIDLPQEWLEPLVYNLAARLGDSYGSYGPVYDRILQRAELLYEHVKMFERVGQQAFYPDDDYIRRE